MKKQILILLGVGALVYGTSTFNTINTEATLTPSFSWTYRYTHYTSNLWILEQYNTNNYTYNPTYTRTGSGSPYNYYSNWNGTVSETTWLPDDLNISLTFNQSNVGDWYEKTSTRYSPQTTAVGTDNTRALSNKYQIELTNNTPKDYLVYLDISNSPNLTDLYAYINNEYYISNASDARFVVSDTQHYVRFWLSSYGQILINAVYSPDFRLFNALYLKELGTNAAYAQGLDAEGEGGYVNGYNDGLIEGYDNGFNNGLKMAPISSLFTAVFGGVAAIFNIRIFGGITFGSIVLAPIAVALLWFILGIVSGVGGKK
jgi:hypothetical protein